MANDAGSAPDPLPSHPDHRYHRLRVARVIDETSDARSIVFEIPAELSEAFRYEAGQFLTVRIPYEGKVLVRCYSLASSPDCDPEHKVTVKRIADGRVSNWINDQVRAGAILEVLPPGGLFTLRAGQNPLLFFAGGSGITPVISLIKSALVSSTRRIRLVYANRDRASVIFARELENLAALHTGRLEIFHRLDVNDGFLSTGDVSAYSSGFIDADCYLCGPAPFMETAERGLLAAPIPRERIHIEKFVSPPDPEDVATEHAGEAAALAGDSIPPFLTVGLDGRDHRVPYERGQTVLVACQQAGLTPPFSCTEGFCGCCMAKLTAGEVRMINNDFLSDREVADGWVLTCQSVPVASACSVKYPD
jgi:3-ketosteroid 9alpha-monooxygenase subunit B